MSFFNIRLHHGGNFDKNYTFYVNGKVALIENCDSEYISYFELKNVIEKKICSFNVKQLYYLVPGLEIGCGLQKVYFDKEVLELCNLAKKADNNIEVFVEHGNEGVDEVRTNVDDNTGGGDEFFRNINVREEFFGEWSSMISCDKLHDTVKGFNSVEEEEGDVSSDDYDTEEDSELEIFEDDVEKVSDDELIDIGRSVRDFKKGKIKQKNEDTFGNGQRDESHPNMEPSTEFNDEALNEIEKELREDNSEEIPTELEEDNEEEVHSQQRKFKMFNPKTDMKNVHLFIGLEFATTDDFRNAVRKYGIDNQIDVAFVKNDNIRLSVKCANAPGCPWRIWVSKVGKERTYRVKVYHHKHMCGKAEKVRQLNAKYLAEMYAYRIMKNPYWKLMDMKQEISSKFEMDVTLGICARAKKRALMNAIGSMKEHYRKLWDYKKELKMKNIGSTVEIDWIRPNPRSGPIFQRIYVCFNALKEGFKAGCRKVIGLDGCFLKGVMKGQLLVAVGRDANNQMYPVAWGVVQIENKENWAWFIELLKEDLEMDAGYGWTIISDQQKGLVLSIKDILPEAEHRNCARHIYANWSKDYKGLEYKLLFWNIAHSTNQAIYNKSCEDLKDCDSSAFTELMKRAPEHWSKSFFDIESKCDCNTNNTTEGFNGSIIEARGLPIIHLLEELRKKIMVRIRKRKEWMEGHWDIICPRIRKKLEERMVGCRQWRAEYNGESKYEVTKGREGYVVDLNKRTCTCREYDLSGIPCTHALCCIFMRGFQIEEYVNTCYTKETFMKIYSHVLQPISGEANWESSKKEKLLPPGFKKTTGRPKRKRVKPTHEEPKKNRDQEVLGKHNIVMHCSVCKREGHNVRTCPNKDKETNTTPTIKKSKNNKNSEDGGTSGKAHNQNRNHGKKTSKEPDALPKRRGRPPKNKSNINIDGIGVCHNPRTGETYYRNPGGFRIVDADYRVDTRDLFTGTLSVGANEDVSASNADITQASHV